MACLERAGHSSDDASFPIVLAVFIVLRDLEAQLGAEVHEESDFADADWTEGYAEEDVYRNEQVHDWIKVAGEEKDGDDVEYEDDPVRPDFVDEGWADQAGEGGEDVDQGQKDRSDVDVCWKEAAMGRLDRFVPDGHGALQGKEREEGGGEEEMGEADD